MNLFSTLDKIRNSKKYRGISEEIIKKEILNYLNSIQKNSDKISENDLKKIKEKLHKKYSGFQTRKIKKIKKYFSDLKESKDLEITKKLLSINLSTKERLNDYFRIYKKIFSLKKPSTIIDLASGFNIFSFPLMNLKKLNYYSYDINKNDINYINEYLKIFPNLQGKAEILDITNLKELSKIPKADLIFMFKIIDLIDIRDHKTSEKIINYLLKNKTNFITVSFPTKTFTRKKMNNPKRKWFELMLNRNKFSFETFSTENEIFYLIRGNQ